MSFDWREQRVLRDLEIWGLGGPAGKACKDFDVRLRGRVAEMSRAATACSRILGCLRVFSAFFGVSGVFRFF